MSKRIPLLLLSQNPKYKAFEDRFDELNKTTRAKIDSLKALSEEYRKEYEATRAAFFAELESAVVADKLASEGYDPATWNIGLCSGVLHVDPPEEKSADDEIPEAIKEIAKKFGVTKGFSINLTAD